LNRGKGRGLRKGGGGPENRNRRNHEGRNTTTVRHLPSKEGPQGGKKVGSEGVSKKENRKRNRKVLEKIVGKGAVKSSRKNSCQNSNKAWMTGDLRRVWGGGVTRKSIGSPEEGLKGVTKT